MLRFIRGRLVNGDRNNRERLRFPRAKKKATPEVPPYCLSCLDSVTLSVQAKPIATRHRSALHDVLLQIIDHDVLLGNDRIYHVTH